MLTRIFDVLISMVALLLLAPILLLIGLAIKLDSPGPALHRSRRVGKDGQIFVLYKFRSMVVHADQLGPGITASNDSRVTPIGRILRRTKLDELPQLVNVLNGDMSLVGPRPEDPRYVALYTADQRRILSVRPGITSAASLQFRNEEQLLSGPDWEERYRQEVLPTKLAIDLEYLSHRNLLSDLQLILRTLMAVIR